MSNPKAYNIKFAAIEMVSKKMVEKPNYKEPTQEFTFNFLVNIKSSSERKIAIVFTEIWAIWPIENIEVARFKTACVFEFPDFESVFTKKPDNKYDIPFDLEVLLKSTGLTTTRGMIYSELKGTYLNGAVMPLVDMATLIQKQKKAKQKAAKKKG